MKQKPIIWYLYPANLAVVVLAAAAVAGFASHAVRGLYEARMEAELLARSRAAVPRLAPLLAAGGELDADARCRDIAALTLSRVTLILPSGRVEGDSNARSRQMENHAHRPEIAEALAGREGTARRWSATLKTDLIYAAVPVRAGGRLVGVLRTAVPVGAVDSTAGLVIRRVALAGLLVTLLAALLSLATALILTRPLRRIRNGAARLGAGDLAFRLEIPRFRELALLAETLNKTADDVTRRIREVTRQRNELEAVLSSMAEGVMAVDRAGRILRVNRAAARFLGRPPEAFPGLAASSVIRNERFSAFLARALSEGGGAEETVDLGPSRPVLLVKSAALHDADGSALGVLLVLLDVTRLQALERVRRDFVANASHEIRTPLSAVKAAVETLLHGGGLDEPETARRFLGIVEKHSERLAAIVDDLLTLSRLEHQLKDEAAPEKTPLDLATLLSAAAAGCAPRAEALGVRVSVEAAPGLTVMADERLLSQALANLLDNALKYGGKSDVDLSASPENGYAVIRCRDRGPGIAREHADRIFERFYRVDEGRSREAGGTGLGLSIVKHAAAAHGGAAGVESVLGRGSTFFIRLPLAEEQ